MRAADQAQPSGAGGDAEGEVVTEVEDSSTSAGGIITEGGMRAAGQVQRAGAGEDTTGDQQSRDNEVSQSGNEGIEGDSEVS